MQCRASSDPPRPAAQSALYRSRFSNQTSGCSQFDCGAIFGLTGLLKGGGSASGNQRQTSRCRPVRDTGAHLPHLPRRTRLHINIVISHRIIRHRPDPRRKCPIPLHLPHASRPLPGNSPGKFHLVGTARCAIPLPALSRLRRAGFQDSAADWRGNDEPRTHGGKSGAAL